MATVTQAAPLRAPLLAPGFGGQDQVGGRPYDCPECGHRLRVFGVGRHRVYFEPENTRLDDPVMDHNCPVCGHAFPGSNRS